MATMDDVRITFFIPAFRAALRALIVPSFAGFMSSSSFLGSPTIKGDAK